MQVTLRRVFDGVKSESLPVMDSHFLIGRGNDCQLRPQSPLVSQRHCEIDVEDTRVTVRDLGSKNGTYVNRDLVEDTLELHSGDVLSVGRAFYEVLIREEACNRREAKHVQRLVHRFRKWGFPLPAPAYT